MAAGERLWLVYAPDTAAFAAGHIPGSGGLVRPAAGAVRRVPVVVYGEDDTAVRAGALAERLADDGVAATWYAGGLRAWAAAGLAVDRLGGG